MIKHLKRERWMVGGGFIHTYNSKEPCYMWTFTDGQPVLFECVIPKGTEYFESISQNEYASKQIKFIKRVR